MASRTDPNLTDKLCSMIIAHFGIPHEVAKGMSRKSILAMMVWDHYPVAVATAKALGWTPDQYNHPSNISGLLALAPTHDIKTATVDVPLIAKGKRITPQQEEFRAKMLAKAGIQSEFAPRKEKRKKAWPTGQKIRSRGFERGRGRAQ